MTKYNVELTEGACEDFELRTNGYKQNTLCELIQAFPDGSALIQQYQTPPLVVPMSFIKKITEAWEPKEIPPDRFFYGQPIYGTTTEGYWTNDADPRAVYTRRLFVGWQQTKTSYGGGDKRLIDARSELYEFHRVRRLDTDPQLNAEEITHNAGVSEALKKAKLAEARLRRRAAQNGSK